MVINLFITTTKLSFNKEFQAPSTLMNHEITVLSVIYYTILLSHCCNHNPTSLPTHIKIVKWDIKNKLDEFFSVKKIKCIN